MRVVHLVAAAFVSGAAAQSLQYDMPLYIVGNAALSKYPDARCLDGSRPGYYWRRATTPEASTKWRIHLRGGGWCTTIESCYGRTQPGGGGSSNDAPAFFDGNRNADWGLLGNASTMPLSLGTWNAVYTLYCDGSSYSSAVDGPVRYNNTDIWFRGFDVLNAMYADMDALGGLLTNATEVVLTGTSAGGMATYIHAPYLRSILPENATVVAVPDAGAFMDAPDAYGQLSWRANIQGAFQLWNASVGANQACMAHYAAEPTEQWRCIMPQYAYAFNDRVPTFVMQSLYDTAQQGIVSRLPCNFAAGACNATWHAYADAYADAMAANLTAIQAQWGDRDGHFFTSCAQHEESCMDYDFGNGAPGVGITIGGQTALDTFALWYSRQNGVSAWRRRDVAWPGDATCQPYGARHGGC